MKLNTYSPLSCSRVNLWTTSSLHKMGCFLEMELRAIELIPVTQAARQIHPAAKVCSWQHSTTSSKKKRVVVVAAAGAGYRRDEENSQLKPPRFCTLRAFSDGQEQILPTTSDTESVFFKQLEASVRATAQARDFETVSGRFSMMAFALALGVEYVTGNTLFKGVDQKQLTDLLLFLVTTMFTVVSFAGAWAAKNEITGYMSKGLKDIADSALSDIVDGLFYDEQQDEEVL